MLLRREQRRRHRETLRGHLAFLIGDRPEFENTAYDVLLRAVDTVVAQFRMVRR